MGKHSWKFIFLLVVITPHKGFSQDSLDFNVKQRLLDYLNGLTHQSANINRLPINACFLKNGKTHTGIVIAGHASLDVCRIASFRVKKLLDSMGYKENTFFSFGVGYDLGDGRNSASYDKALGELESRLRLLQEQYPLEVNVETVEDSVFKPLSERLKQNALLAFATLKNNDSVNRIIFRYDSIAFPLPVPFYDEGGPIRFAIPKKVIGPIPGVRVYDPSILDSALREIRVALQTNTSALNFFNRYEPVVSPGKQPGRYSVNVYNGARTVKVNLDSYDALRLLRVYTSGPISEETHRYYSLSDLQRECNIGVAYLPEKTSKGELISPCEQLQTYADNVKLFKEEKADWLRDIPIINIQLETEKNRILEYKAQLKEVASSSDSLVLIDGFLRGWNFKANTAALNRQLRFWYSRRPMVWQKVLSLYPSFRERNEANSLNVNRIAGIFQYEDVFFSVKDEGDNYVIFPYKMVTGRFIQVVDKKQPVSQLFTENNFRLTKF